MAEKAMTCTRGKLLVNMATKTEKIHTNDVHSQVKECPRSTFEKLAKETNNATDGQQNYSGLETSQIRGEEFELVPCDQENVFILKPILPAVKFTDEPFNFQRILSEGVEINNDVQNSEKEITNENETTVQLEEDSPDAEPSFNLEQILSNGVEINNDEQNPAKQTINENEKRMHLEEDSLNTEPSFDLEQILSDEVEINNDGQNSEKEITNVNETRMNLMEESPDTESPFDLEQIIFDGVEINNDEQNSEKEITNENEARMNLEEDSPDTEPSFDLEQILFDGIEINNDGQNSEKDITNENEARMNLEEDSPNTEQGHEMNEMIKDNPKKRKRNKKPMKELWKSEENKLKRMKGEDYLGRRKNDAKKNVFDVARPKRKLKPRCTCKDKRNSLFKCNKFTEERREALFKYFWELDWKEKRILVKQLVDRRSVAYRRVNSLEFRRKGSLYYHLKINDNEQRSRVCKRMFLNTLGLGEWSVTNWISNSTTNSQETEQLEEDVDGALNGEINEIDPNTQSNSNNQNKRKDDSIRKKVVREFFDKLPKLESHYCRKNTSKLYLEPNWQSKAQLYRHYKSYCEMEGKENFIASDCLFYSVFNELNLGLFSPKKDQCDVCCSFNKGNLSQEEYDAHVRRKVEARTEKTNDKDKNDERTAVFTMDMQAVLLSPSLKASALYYKSKLKVHNFTIYNLKTNEAVCYLWNESEGGLDADEFASIITHFITHEVDNSKIDNVIIYSDGCTYQNRNCVLSNALLLTSIKTGLTITQKYLEKGHTQMECDSMHSVIERKLRNREIYSPAGYVEVCRTARNSPGPYKVHYLDHTFFLKYSKLQFVSSIRPGNKKGDPVVTNLRCIEYKPDGTIKIKLNFSDEFSDLPRRIKKPPCDVGVESAYNKRIPIKSRLFKDLQALKVVLPRDVHGFYDNLPHYKNETKIICRGEDDLCCTCVKSVP